MMYLFMNEKGGVGKSTLATTMAVFLHDVGRLVGVLDADPQLHTQRALAEAESSIPTEAQCEPDEIRRAIKRLLVNHDDVVADAPALLGDETRALMVMADVVVFPFEPSLKSLRSTKKSIKVLEYAREITGGRPRDAWLVLNKARTRTRICREVRLLAPQLGVPLAQTTVRFYEAYIECDQQGTVITRMSPTDDSIRNAQADIHSLFAEIVKSRITRAANE